MNEQQLEAQRKYLVKLRKRKQREKSRRMRGNRWIFLRNMLSINRYYEACTLDVDVLTVNTDDWWNHYSSVSAILLDTPRGISADDIRRRIAEGE